jgi:hypothetical protein
MIYYQSEKGYFYKKYKNGDTIRISESEYNKNEKTQEGGRFYKCMRKRKGMPKGKNVKMIESRFDPTILNENLHKKWICNETNLRKSSNKSPGCHLGAVPDMDCVPCSVKPTPKACRGCVSSNKNSPEIFYCKKKEPLQKN